MTTRSEEADAAVDRLWEFQLRREHSALLEELKAIKALVESQKNTAQSLSDALQATVEGRLTSLNRCSETQAATLRTIQDHQDGFQTTVGKLSQGFNDIRGDFRSLRQRINADLLGVEGTQFEVNSLKRKLKELDDETQFEVNTLKRQLKDLDKETQIEMNVLRRGLMLSNERQAQTIGQTEGDLISPSVPTNTSSSLKSGLESGQRIPAPTQVCPTTNRPVNKTHHNLRSKAKIIATDETRLEHDPATGSHGTPSNANTGIRKKRRQQTPSPSPSPQRYEPLPKPELKQRKYERLVTFVERVDAVSKTINPRDGIRLAAMFFSGMKIYEEQIKLLNSLTEKDMAENGDDGQMLIKCKWSDLLLVMTELEM